MTPTQELMAALEPFAREANSWDAKSNDGHVFEDREIAHGIYGLTVGQLRRARDAYNALTKAQAVEGQLKRRDAAGNVLHGCEMCDGEDECTCPGNVHGRKGFNPVSATTAPVDGWRDIASAPRDRPIWLGKSGHMRLGFWLDGKQHENFGTSGGGWIDSASSEAPGPRGLRFAPTCWHPVLAAPASAPEVG